MRAFLNAAKELADARNGGAIAAMMALLMGMRCCEIIRCVARDVDDRGRLLWIPMSKTFFNPRPLDFLVGSAVEADEKLVSDARAILARELERGAEHVRGSNRSHDQESSAVP